MPKDVLILGGGFAGLAAAGRLAMARLCGADVSVRLIDRLPHSVFLPLLPDLISGGIAPEHICHPLEPHCCRIGVEFVHAEARGIDLAGCRVVTSAGDFTADYLILAPGSETNFYGNDSFRGRVHGLKGPAEAAALRRDVRRRIARSRGPVPVLVIGGGYSGFEAAGQIARLVHLETRLPYDRIARAARIQVIEAAPQVLPHSSPAVRRSVTDLVARYGVEVRTGVTLRNVPEPGTAELTDGAVVRDAVVLWTPGVKPASALDALSVARARDRRLIADAHLRLPGFPRVFVAGDAASATPPGRSAPLYMGVQFSLRGGTCAAVNVLRAIRGKPPAVFDPWDLGYLVPLAGGRAAGRVLGRETCGRIPCTLHYAMCIARSWGWRNRAGVAGDLLSRRSLPDDSLHAGGAAPCDKTAPI